MVSWSGNNRIGAGLSVITGAASQDIVLERIEPDPGQLPCPQQTVIYLCQVMVPSSSLTWTLPTGGPLEFDILSDEGDFRNSSDNVYTYSATLTAKMEDTDPDTNRFFFSSTLLTLETVNGSNITCAGATVPDLVEDSTDIILSGMSLQHLLCIYYSFNPQALQTHPLAWSMMIVC